MAFSLIRPSLQYLMSIDLENLSSLRANMRVVRDDMFGDEKLKGRCDVRFDKLFVAYCKDTGWIALGRTRQLLFKRQAGEDTYESRVR